VETLADRLKNRRRVLGWRQVTLARRAGVSKTYLCELEAGATGVGADILQKLAHTLGVSLDWLMTGEDSSSMAQLSALTKNASTNKIGAAILGFYGAVKLCRASGFDEAAIFAMVRDHVNNEPGG
jgi:transcriptional regulator with XRE-family HTH domain